MGLIKKIDGLKGELQNRSEVVRILGLWLEKKIDNVSFVKEYLNKKLDDELNDKEISSVAIYGNNLYSGFIVKELLSENIDVKYMVANEWDVNIYGLNIIKEADFKSNNSKEEYKVDAIINTTNDRIDTTQKVISVFDIIYNK